PAMPRSQKTVLESLKSPANREINLLIVEDEHHLADSVARRMEEEGYSVDVANDGEEGYRLASTKKYHLIVLDLLLPKKDGLQVLREIRRNKVQSMVLILTARSTVEERVDGLRLGADDYLTKPFAFAELLARVESLLRRQGVGHGPVLRVADVELDIETRAVRRSMKNIQLTAKEYLLLEFLMRNKNRILTRREIAEQVWGYTFDTGTNVVDVYVNYLRKAIDEGFPRRLIHTVRGVGFIFKEE
ncbi:MAG TPA: response regulator transcription factor, partial [Bacteroidota bacterium]|nr:response regulator transcription factor [Bacteroidota bacterium]